MKSDIQFTSSGQAIKGKFYSAVGEFRTFPTILMLSGFPGNENDVLGLCKELSHLGINCLTFNYRGIHRSEGDYSLRNSQADIQAAFDFLREGDIAKQYQIDRDKLVLGGWSYGGGMALTFAANQPLVRSVFSVAGTDHGEFAREYCRNETFAAMVDDIFESLKRPDGPVRFSGKDAIRNELIKNPDPYDLVLHAKKLVDRNILLIGGWDDANVVLENHILPLYRFLREQGAKNVVIRAFQDDHAFDKSRSAIVSTICSWVEAHDVGDPADG